MKRRPQRPGTGSRPGRQGDCGAADVSIEDEVIALFHRVDTELGRVTALVNNAGTVGHKSRVDEMSEFRILKIMKTNVLGPILCAKHAMLRMSPRHGGQGGSIVNVSSVAARLGAPGEYVDYAASRAHSIRSPWACPKKWRARAFASTPCARLYLHRLPCPERRSGSGQQTGVGIPMARGGRPDEVAEAIIWLLSDKASYATGTFIDLGGGR
jgi:NAD(P)-dependent dehydrogenase (short-subunit alcohol dehydrogenase family)